MFTAEQQEQLTSLITNAMTTQLNAFKTEFKTELINEVNTRNSGLAAAVNRDVNKKLEAYSTSSGNDEASNAADAQRHANAADTNATGNASGSESSSSGRLTLAALNREKAELEAKVKELSSKWETAEKRASQKSLNSTLSDLCASNKVRSEAFATARDAFLFRNQSKLKSQESSSDPDTLDWFIYNSETDAVPLQKAFSEYLASDEGKLFIAHNGPQGSGVKEQPKQLNFSSSPSVSSSQPSTNAFGRAIATQELARP